jgi:hypothetical protein
MGLKKEFTRKIGRFYRTVFLIVFALSFSAEILIFLRCQANLIFAKLKDDFRIILTIGENLSASETESIERQLRTEDKINSVRFVSKEENLKFLTENGQILAEDMKSVDKNILPYFFELEPSTAALADLDGWLEKNITGKIKGVTGFYYNESQSPVILQIDFYRKFLLFALGLSAFIIALCAFLLALESAGKSVETAYAKEAGGYIFSAVLASAFSVLLVWVSTVFMKKLNPVWWCSPALREHLIIVFFGAVLGWVLFRWKNT